MYQVTNLRSDYAAQLVFSQPIFDWQNLPSRFFSVVYRGLSGRYQVGPKDFSVSPSTVMGDVWARYNIFGGVNTLTLSPTGLEIQFIGLTDADTPIASEITRYSHDAFVSDFDEVNFSSLDHRTHVHLRFPSAAVAEDYFNRLNAPTFSSNADDPDTLVKWGVHFTMHADDGGSSITVTGEQSALSTSAIFLAINVRINDVSQLPTFDDKSEHLGVLLSRGLGVLQLRLEGAISDG